MSTYTGWLVTTDFLSLFRKRLRCFLSNKLFDDKTCVLKTKGKLLKEKYDVALIATRRKNMKSQNLLVFDKKLLRGVIIERVSGQLKNISRIEYTCHRSKFNFMVNLLAGLVTDAFEKKKPSLNVRCSEVA